MSSKPDPERSLRRTLLHMVIDTSGGAWTGSDASDLDEYLLEFSRSTGEAVSRVGHSVCGDCDSNVFRLRVDDEEGCVERTCTSCGTVVLMLDSAEFVDDAELEECACPCGGEAFNVAVGYALHEDDDVRWIFVGARCVDDGVLGCYADWKIDYGPSGHLLTLT